MRQIIRNLVIVIPPPKSRANAPVLQHPDLELHVVLQVTDTPTIRAELLLKLLLLDETRLRRRGRGRAGY
jgi:hypothetical protein